MYRLLTVLLLSSLAFSQTAQPASPKPPANLQISPAPEQKRETPGVKPAEKKDAEVAPSAAVITIDGLCAKPAATPADCKTVITRAEFDKLADALSPDMPQARRRQLANAYAQMLVMSETAQKRGLEDKPDTQRVLQFAKLQALSQILIRDIQEEARKVPPAEEQKYYDEHKANFTEASMQRIFLPKNPPEAGANPPDEKAKADREAKLKAEADKIHAAAVAGEDFDKLQKQAYDDLGMKSTPPPTQAGVMRQNSLPPAQAKVFDLEPGKVSEPLDTPGGFYIYKLVSKKTLTLPEARAEIDRVLEGERMQQIMGRITKSMKPVFNEAYFGPMTEAGHPPAAPGPPAARPSRPPARPAAPPRAPTPPPK